MRVGALICIVSQALAPIIGTYQYIQSSNTEDAEIAEKMHFWRCLSDKTALKMVESARKF